MKEKVALLQFYINDLAEAINAYDPNMNNKMDIKATTDVWRNDVLVASSLVDELMNELEEHDGNPV